MDFVLLYLNIRIGGRWKSLLFTDNSSGKIITNWTAYIKIVLCKLTNGLFLKLSSSFRPCSTTFLSIKFDLSTIICTDTVHHKGILDHVYHKWLFQFTNSHWIKANRHTLNQPSILTHAKVFIFCYHCNYGSCNPVNRQKYSTRTNLLYTSIVKNKNSPQI